VIGPKFFAEALAEYEDAVAYYEEREEGLGVGPTLSQLSGSRPRRLQ